MNPHRTPATNTKGNDMKLFNWISNFALRVEIKQLRRDYAVLDVRFLDLQKEYDELYSSNEANFNLMTAWHGSAAKLTKECDGLKLEKDRCLTKICKLQEQVTVLKTAIETAASVANCSEIDEDSPE